MIYFFIYTIVSIAVSNSTDSVLNNYPIGTDQYVQFRLPAYLNEISGLTVSNDGRLFAHNDEKAAIYEIDYNTSVVKKTFYLGSLTINRDFEDIALAGKIFYLITSSGVIYKFEEGTDGNNVDYEIIDLKISDKFNIEGLCYDPSENSLLIASK